MTKAKNVRAATLWPETPIVLRMIEKNTPLSKWRMFMETGNQGTGHYYKDHKKIAAVIYRQLTHPDARTIIAHEWDDLGPEIRMALGTLAENGDGSNNVSKGCQDLNNMVGGRLLRKVNGPTARVAGKTFQIDQAKAGAIRKYGLDDDRFKIVSRR